MTRVYAQLYDYSVIVSLRKNADNVYEPYVKFKFPPQVGTNNPSPVTGYLGGRAPGPKPGKPGFKILVTAGSLCDYERLTSILAQNQNKPYYEIEY